MRADAELVGVETRNAVAVGGGGVVDRVDGAGHAVTVADEVVGGALLTLTAHQTVTGNADAGVG